MSLRQVVSENSASRPDVATAKIVSKSEWNTASLPILDFAQCTDKVENGTGLVEQGMPVNRNIPIGLVLAQVVSKSAASALEDQGLAFAVLLDGSKRVGTRVCTYTVRPPHTVRASDRPAQKRTIEPGCIFHSAPRVEHVDVVGGLLRQGLPVPSDAVLDYYAERAALIWLKRRAKYFEGKSPQHDSRTIPVGLQLALLATTYVMDDRFAIGHFIEQNHLYDLLVEARQPLKSNFGEDSVKSLSLISDDEGFEVLYCSIATSRTLQESLEALRCFDQEWWLSRVARAAGRLIFDFVLV